MLKLKTGDIFYIDNPNDGAKGKGIILVTCEQPIAGQGEISYDFSYDNPFPQSKALVKRYDGKYSMYRIEVAELPFVRQLKSRKGINEFLNKELITTQGWSVRLMRKGNKLIEKTNFNGNGAIFGGIEATYDML